MKQLQNAAIALALALTPLPVEAQTQGYNGIPVWVVDGDITSAAMSAAQTNSWRQDTAAGYGIGLMYLSRYWRSGFSGAWETNRGWRSRSIYLDCSSGVGYFNGITSNGTPREGSYSATQDGRKIFWQGLCNSKGASRVFQ